MIYPKKYTAVQFKTTLISIFEDFELSTVSDSSRNTSQSGKKSWEKSQNSRSFQKLSP